VKACASRVRAIVDGVRPDAILAVGKVAEAAIAAGEWASPGRSPVTGSIADVDRLVRDGHPMAETEKVVLAQIARVRRLIARSRGGRGSAGPSTPPPDSACPHEPIAVGLWIDPKGVEAPMMACVRCARLIGAPVKAG
jgi:hypothetical protein